MKLIIFCVGILAISCSSLHDVTIEQAASLPVKNFDYLNSSNLEVKNGICIDWNSMELTQNCNENYTIYTHNDKVVKVVRKYINSPQNFSIFSFLDSNKIIKEYSKNTFNHKSIGDSFLIPSLLYKYENEWFCFSFANGQGLYAYESLSTELNERNFKFRVEDIFAIDILDSNLMPKRKLFIEKGLIKAIGVYTLKNRLLDTIKYSLFKNTINLESSMKISELKKLFNVKINNSDYSVTCKIDSYKDADGWSLGYGTEPRTDNLDEVFKLFKINKT